MKIGLIRCLQTEEECSGIHCLKTIENKEGAFDNIDQNLELICITTCGGCPGNKVSNKVKMMIEGGVDTIVFSSCIKLGTPIGFPCPNFKNIKRQIHNEGENIKLIDWTHYSTFKEILLSRIKTTNLSNLDRFFTKGLSM